MEDRYWWEAEGWRADLVPYVLVIRAFVEQRISAPEFEVMYLAIFKRDPNQWAGRLFDILDRLFAAVDDYCADPQLRQEVGGLNDEELRDIASSALVELSAIGKQA